MMTDTVPGTLRIRISGAQFEFGFPLLAWQILFGPSVLADYYKIEIIEFLSRPEQRYWIWPYAAMSLGFMDFSLNNAIRKRRVTWHSALARRSMTARARPLPSPLVAS